MNNRMVIGGLVSVVALAAGIYASTTLGQSGRNRDARPIQAERRDETPMLTSDDVQPSEPEVPSSAPIGHAPPASTVARANGPIAWQMSFASATSTAKPDQLIFVDVYTDWCTWCKYMDQRVYSDSRVQKFAADQVFVKLNAEDNAEGTAFARRVGVRGFPTLLVYSHDGRLIASQPGAFRRADDFLSWLQSASSRH